MEKKYIVFEGFKLFKNIFDLLRIVHLLYVLFTQSFDKVLNLDRALSRPGYQVVQIWCHLLCLL